jgi:hypothetical protein
MNDKLAVTSIRLTSSKLHEVKLTGEKISNVPARFSGHLADSITVMCRTIAIKNVCHICPTSSVISFVNLHYRQTGAGRRFLSGFILTHLAAYFSFIDGTEIQIVPFDESDVRDMGQIVDFVVSKGGTPIGSTF